MNSSEKPYIVSSLKYRPQVFDDVIGQDHISQTLRNAVIRDRLANGYLFTGPRGVGKTTTARILAKALNCENPHEGNPCNQCTHCQEITSGRNMDVLEVDGASTRGIDAIRELREVVKYPPTNSNYRIYIIDEVHMLTKEAFNALLKTLEEPPAQVLFIFATTEPQKVPLTILSRCQRYDFRMVGMTILTDHLGKIAGKEGIQIDSEALHLLAGKAAGSVRDSLSLLDKVTAFADKAIDPALVREILGILDRTLYIKLVAHILDQDARATLAFVADLLSSGIGIDEFMEGLAEHLRNLLILKIAGSGTSLDLAENEIAALQTQSERLDERDLIRMQNLVLAAIRQFRMVRNQPIHLELLLLKMVHLTRAFQLDELLTGTNYPPRSERKSPPVRPPSAPSPTVGGRPQATSQLDTPKAKLASPAKKPEPPQEEKDAGDSSSTVTEQSASMDLKGVIAGWDSFLEKLKAESQTLGSFMQEGEAAALGTKGLEICFSPEQAYHVERLQRETKRVQKIFSESYGVATKLHFKVKPGQKTRKKRENSALEHPTTQHALNIFDGELLDND